MGSRLLPPVSIGEMFEINGGHWACLAVSPMAVEWRIDARPIDAHGEATFFVPHHVPVKVLQDA